MTDGRWFAFFVAVFLLVVALVLFSIVALEENKTPVDPMDTAIPGLTMMLSITVAFMVKITKSIAWGLYLLATGLLITLACETRGGWRKLMIVLAVTGAVLTGVIIFWI
jgi:hypothetical protein